MTRLKIPYPKDLSDIVGGLANAKKSRKQIFRELSKDLRLKKHYKLTNSQIKSAIKDEWTIRGW